MSALTTVLVVLVAVIATVAVMTLYKPFGPSESEVVVIERGDWWGPWHGPWWHDGGRGAAWPWRPHPHRPYPGHAMLGPGGTRHLLQ